MREFLPNVRTPYSRAIASDRTSIGAWCRRSAPTSSSRQGISSSPSGRRASYACQSGGNPTWRLGLARVREDRSGGRPTDHDQLAVPKPMAGRGRRLIHPGFVNVCERATVVTWLVNSTSRTWMAQ